MIAASVIIIAPKYAGPPRENKQRHIPSLNGGAGAP